MRHTTGTSKPPPVAPMHASATARAAEPAPHPVFTVDASTAAMKHPFSACTHRSLVLSDALSATSCTHTHTYTHTHTRAWRYGRVRATLSFTCAKKRVREHSLHLGKQVPIARRLHEPAPSVAPPAAIRHQSSTPSTSAPSDTGKREESLRARHTRADSTCRSRGHRRMIVQQLCVGAQRLGVPRGLVEF